MMGQCCAVPSVHNISCDNRDFLLKRNIIDTFVMINNLQTYLTHMSTFSHFFNCCSFTHMFKFRQKAYHS